MTDEWVRDACWEWASPPLTDQGWERLTARVASAPERFWASTRQLISESGDPPTARLYGGALAALVELGGEWPQRVAAVARQDPKLASALEDALLDDRRTYDLLGRDALVEGWVRYQSEESPWDFWAIDLLACPDWLTDDERWSVILELANAAPDEEVIAMVGVGPIEDFLSHDWRSALERIERDAPFHENLRKALWSVWQLSGVPPSVVERVHQVADQPPGTPHRF